MKEGVLTHREDSPTAASAGKKLFEASGVQTYRVILQTAFGGVATTDVDAATGDGAAEAALAQYPGSKVANVSPAPQGAQHANG
jgi:hypothetical protein